jgi:hypothetical protein
MRIILKLAVCKILFMTFKQHQSQKMQTNCLNNQSRQEYPFLQKTQDSRPLLKKYTIQRTKLLEFFVLEQNSLSGL